MLNEHVFLKVLYIFNKYFFIVTVYIWGVYAVVKNQKSSPAFLDYTCAKVKMEKNCVQLIEYHGRLRGIYLGVREGLTEETWT